MSDHAKNSAGFPVTQEEHYAYQRAIRRYSLRIEQLEMDLEDARRELARIRANPPMTANAGEKP